MTKPKNKIISPSDIVPGAFFKRKGSWKWLEYEFIFIFAEYKNIKDLHEVMRFFKPKEKETETEKEIMVLSTETIIMDYDLLHPGKSKENNVKY